MYFVKLNASYIRIIREIEYTSVNNQNTKVQYYHIE